MESLKEDYGLSTFPESRTSNRGVTNRGVTNRGVTRSMKEGIITKSNRGVTRSMKEGIITKSNRGVTRSMKEGIITKSNRGVTRSMKEGIITKFGHLLINNRKVKLTIGERDHSDYVQLILLLVCIVIYWT